MISASEYTNYDDVLDQMRDFGADIQFIDGIDTDEWVRAPEASGRRGNRNISYKVYSLQTEAGQRLICGTLTNWHTGEQARIEFKRSIKLSKDDRSAIRAKAASDREHAKNIRAKKAEKAAVCARNFWRDKCIPMADDDLHGYLVAKQCRSHGLKVSSKGALVVPLYNVQGSMQGLMLILNPDTQSEAIARMGGRNKLFWPKGMVKRGHFFTIGTITPNSVVLMAEGYATAASLHEATGLPVVVAFDAGNLMPVATALTGYYKRLRILVCADDDYQGRCNHCRKKIQVAIKVCPHCNKEHNRVNTGVVKASTAAMTVSGRYIKPVFSDAENRGTDWNDLAGLEGSPVVKAQIMGFLDSLDWPAFDGVQPSAKGGRSDDPTIRTVEQAVDELFLVLGGGSAVFYTKEGIVMALQDARDLCASPKIMREWQSHPCRRVVYPDQVGFWPDRAGDPSICNFYLGPPLEPKADDGVVPFFLDVLKHLVGGDVNLTDDESSKAVPDVYTWILKWLAYPLQNPGVKMQTSILMHGPEGSGKNLFFRAIFQIYGKYAVSFNQSDLEDRFNDIFSAKLFAIGNEVIAKEGAAHLPGKIKTMITEEVWTINPKTVKKRQERNCCNFVFFSNSPAIAKLDYDDRRFCVVWTPAAKDDDLYEKAGAALNNGGAAALYDWLLRYDVGDFDQHTKPPRNKAKSDLIELTMGNPQRFYKAWGRNETEWAYGPCDPRDLYQCFRRWCSAEGERWTDNCRSFKSAIKKFDASHKEICADIDGKTVRCFVPGTETAEAFFRGDAAPSDADRSDRQWVKRVATAFRRNMNRKSDGDDS